MKLGECLMRRAFLHSAWHSPNNIQMVCQKLSRLHFTDKASCSILPLWHILLALRAFNDNYWQSFLITLLNIGVNHSIGAFHLLPF